MLAGGAACASPFQRLAGARAPGAAGSQYVVANSPLGGLGCLSPFPCSAAASPAGPHQRWQREQEQQAAAAGRLRGASLDEDAWALGARPSSAGPWAHGTPVWEEGDGVGRVPGARGLRAGSAAAGQLASGGAAVGAVDWGEWGPIRKSLKGAVDAAAAAGGAQGSPGRERARRSPVRRAGSEVGARAGGWVFLGAEEVSEAARAPRTPGSARTLASQSRRVQ